MSESPRGDRLSHAELAKLSNLRRARLDEFVETWPQRPVQERRRIVRRLVDMAEDNVELNYHDLLLRLTDDADPQVRNSAIDGLWEDERTTSAERLIEIARADADEGVRATAIDALARFARRMVLGELPAGVTDRIRAVLLEHLGEDAPEMVRRRAIEAGGYLGEGVFREAMVSAYASQDPGLRASAVNAMGRSCDPDWLDTVLRELQNEDAEMRFEAARAAGEMAEERAVPALIDAMSDEDAEVRLAAIESLGAIGGDRARQALHRARMSEDPAISEAADEALDELEVVSDPLGVRVRDVEPN